MSYAPGHSDSNTSAPSYISPYPPQPYQPHAAATAGTSAAGASGSGSGGAEPTSTRRADELARKERTLAGFMLMLDAYDLLVSFLADERGGLAGWMRRAPAGA